MGGLTSRMEARVAALASSSMGYAIGSAGNLKDLVAALGAATVALAQNMKPVNVTRTGSVAAGEGTYHAAVADKEADRVAAWAAATAGLPSSEVLQRTFTAAQSQAEADWLAGIAGPFTTYATAMATAEADEIIALAQALAGADNGRSQADHTRVMSCEPAYYNERVNSHAVQRVYAQGEAARAGVRRLAEASVYKLLDVEYATAAKNQAVSYAEADKEFWVGKFSLDEGASDAALVVARDVAMADAILAYATRRADADLVWAAGKAAVPPSPEDPDGEPAVAGIVAGDWELAEGRATGWRNLQVSLADIRRDTIFDCTGPLETHTNSYAAAQVAFWNAEVAAANARNTAEANAIANFRTADYATSATAIAGIHAAIDLPWTDYQADLAAALSAWWVGHGHPSQIAVTAAVNAAYIAMSSTVGNAWVAWVADTAEARRAQVEAATNAQFGSAEAFANADQEYAHAVATNDKSWQSSIAQAIRSLDVGIATELRSWVQTGENVAEFAPSQALLDQFGNSRTVAKSTWMLAEAGDNAARVDLVSDAYVQAVTSAYFGLVDFAAARGDANVAFVIALWDAVVAFKSTRAAAEAEQFVTQAATFADTAAALASSNPSPWSVYEHSVAAAHAARAATIAPARRDFEIAVIDAHRDYYVVQSQESRIRDIAIANAEQDAGESRALAERDQALLQVEAETSLIQSSPNLDLQQWSDAAVVGGVGTFVSAVDALFGATTLFLGSAAQIRLPLPNVLTPPSAGVTIGPASLADFELPNNEIGRRVWENFNPDSPEIQFVSKPLEFPSVMYNGQEVIVTIKTRGTRFFDYEDALEQAKKQFGSGVEGWFNRKYGILHHKSFNPATGEMTLQLVNPLDHRPGHIGGWKEYLDWVRQYVNDPKKLKELNAEQIQMDQAGAGFAKLRGPLHYRHHCRNDWNGCSLQTLCDSRRNGTCQTARDRGRGARPRSHARHRASRRVPPIPSGGQWC